MAHALFVPPGVCCNFCVFFCPFWYPDAMVTSLVSPTRGFTFRFCVSGGERFFPRVMPRVDGMAVSSALGGSPQSVVPRPRARLTHPRQRLRVFAAGPHRLVSLLCLLFFCPKRDFSFFRGDFLSRGGESFFSRRAGPRIGDGYTKLSLTPAGVPNES